MIEPLFPYIALFLNKQVKSQTLRNTKIHCLYHKRLRIAKKVQLPIISQMEARNFT